jgi:hypothetical protein
MFTDESLESRLAELTRLRDVPWLSRFDAGDLAELVAAYEAAVAESARTGEDKPVDDLLAAWEQLAQSRPEPEATE